MVDRRDCHHCGKYRGDGPVRCDCVPSDAVPVAAALAPWCRRLRVEQFPDARAAGGTRGPPLAVSVRRRRAERAPRRHRRHRDRLHLRPRRLGARIHCRRLADWLERGGDRSFPRAVRRVVWPGPAFDLDRAPCCATDRRDDDRGGDVSWGIGTRRRGMARLAPRRGGVHRLLSRRGRRGDTAGAAPRLFHRAGDRGCEPGAGGRGQQRCVLDCTAADGEERDDSGAPRLSKYLLRRTVGGGVAPAARPGDA